MAGKSEILFLLGMPGSGKSFWGSAVSGEFGLQFLDTDKLVEEKTEKSITDIFNIYGEDHFRKLEHEAINEIIEDMEGSYIVSVGGGAPFFHGNMQLMKDAGITVYLKADTEFLVEHL